jgi:uncharacterized protein (TIGR03000 family)
VVYGGVPVIGVGAPVAPATTEPPPMKSASLNAATVVVKAPTDVKIKVDGQETPRNAVEESFTTPDLEPGRSYQYVFTAEAVRDGKTVTRTKRVTVQAGRMSEADFSELSEDRGEADVAKVTVRVPQDAKVYVDGVLCPIESGKSTFETPKLQAGRQYFYTIKAQMLRDGQNVSESRRVIVQAGKSTSVEFKEISNVQAARR